jgi:hypothetical protein
LRSRPLTGRFPSFGQMHCAKKIYMDGRVISMAVMEVCGINEYEHKGRDHINFVKKMNIELSVR